MDPMTLMAGSSIIGGALDFFGGNSANRANARLAREQMDFQERMSNTAYQRAVKDLKAADLNPMLAYTNGGAVAGSGASATMQNTAGSAVSTARKVAETWQSVKNAKETNAMIKAQTNAANTQADLNSASKTKTIADTAKSLADASVSNALKNKVQAETKNLGISGRILGNTANKSDFDNRTINFIDEYWKSALGTAKDVINHRVIPSGKREYNNLLNNDIVKKTMRFFSR